jgi:ABC-type uncharacterized transport system permease subunit
VQLALYSLTALVLLFGLKSKDNKLSTHRVLQIHTIINSLLLGYGVYTMTHLTPNNILQCLSLAMIITYVISTDKNIPKPISISFLFITFIIIILSYTINEPQYDDDAISGLKAKKIYTHIFLAFCGYTSFLILSLSSFFYIWQSKILKSRKGLNKLTYFPNLLELELLQKRSLFIGIVVFTIAIGLGKINQEAFGIDKQWGTKEILSIMIWTLYMILAIMRIFQEYLNNLLLHFPWWV